MNLAPQLAFRGNCREAFTFYAELLRGEITVMNSFGSNADKALPPGSVAGPDGAIRFGELRFGDKVLRGNDVSYDQFEAMRGFSLSLHVAEVEDARRIFGGLAEGGEVTTPLSEVEWAKLFGMVVDRFGVPWLILAVDG